MSTIAAANVGPSADRIDVVFTADEIAARVRILGKELRAAAGDEPIFLLGILKGATCFLADLLRAVGGEASYGFIDVVSDMADTHTAAAMEIDFLSWIDIAGRNVFVLKDVVSTGIIETYLLTQLRQKNPARLELVALIDRPSLRTVELKAGYRAFEAAEGAYVGYGLELDGKQGNLPYIGRVIRG
jgi:hypoxanthine phosphoribosyltransferase